jgi:hypothetical protein
MWGLSQTTQRRQHQQQSHFNDRLRVGSRHVADRDAAAASSIEIDRIDADPDLLDQPEIRRARSTSP